MFAKIQLSQNLNGWLKMQKGKVLLNWMERLTWKQQSAIICASRGLDTYYCPNIKRISKFIRSITQKNGDIYGGYMKTDKLPSYNLLKKEFEFCSVHYIVHLLQGLEIIAYEHQNKNISKTAKNYYIYFVHRLHLNPETKEHMKKRLQDRI